MVKFQTYFKDLTRGLSFFENYRQNLQLGNLSDHLISRK